MGKKRCRSKKTSKGQRNSISRNTVRLVRADRMEGDKIINKLKAWMKGKRGYVTIANPNPNEVDRPFIKVTFEQHFGGLYKDVKYRVRASEDKNRVEV